MALAGNGLLRTLQLKIIPQPPSALGNQLLRTGVWDQTDGVVGELGSDRA
jgi:hypothetical protein